MENDSKKAKPVSLKIDWATHEAVKSMGKLKFVLFLDKDLGLKLEYKSKPYPKRAGSKANVAVEFHSTEGGATPTSALQLNANS